MIKLKAPIVCFDVDDTLLFWDNDEVPQDRLMEEVQFEFKGKILKRYYIREHLRELQLQKESGSTIIVWSKSGADWAEAAVNALEIDEFVDLVTEKPARIYDDKEAEQWMPTARYYASDLLKG